MNDAFIRTCKVCIDEGNLAGLQKCYAEIQSESDFNWEYIFYRVYLHACLKKKKDIADWLTEIFAKLDPIDQASLRQIFPYGRHLLGKL